MIDLRARPAWIRHRDIRNDGSNETTVKDFAFTFHEGLHGPFRDLVGCRDAVVTPTNGTNDDYYGVSPLGCLSHNAETDNNWAVLAIPADGFWSFDYGAVTWSATMLSGDPTNGAFCILGDWIRSAGDLYNGYNYISYVDNDSIRLRLEAQVFTYNRGTSLRDNKPHGFAWGWWFDGTNKNHELYIDGERILTNTITLGSNQTRSSTEWGALGPYAFSNQYQTRFNGIVHSLSYSSKRQALGALAHESAEPFAFLRPRIPDWLHAAYFEVSGGTTHDLVVQDASHGHIADSLTLNIGTSLAVNKALHSHIADDLLLNIGTALIINGASHAHLADNLTLNIGTLLAVNDAVHSHTSENLTLQTAQSLEVNDALHGHIADNLTLNIGALLSVNDALHGHIADNLSLNIGTLLVVNDAKHDHIADNLTLNIGTALIVNDAVHGHTSENLTLDTSITLVVASSNHAHLADNLDLNIGALLAVNDAVHAHIADNLTLNAGVLLVISDAVHAHLADNLTLTLSAATVSEALTLNIEPDDIILYIAEDDNILRVR